MTIAQDESETFSSVDAAWLHMDSPTNLAVITGVICFDGVVDFERLKATLASRFLIHRRFRQRVIKPGLPLGLPRWQTDPSFDLDNHLHRISLPEPAGQQELQDMVSDLMSLPLDETLPLWQFYYVDKFENGSALICRLHHCIADGLALVQVLLDTADADPDAPWPEPAEETIREVSLFARLMRPVVNAARAAGHTWKSAGDLVHEGFDTFRHPTRVFDATRAGANITLALGKLLLLPPDRGTILRGRCGVNKRAAWSTTIKLDEVKGIGRMMGGTVNDILLSAITGALRRYIEGQGKHTEGLNIRAVVPVNLRPPEESDLMGNRFGLVFLSLPVGIRDPLKRLLILRRRMNDIKNSPEAIVAMGILMAIGMTPKQIEDIIVRIFGMKGTAVMTNVPGPQQPLYFAGKKISTIMFWVPTPGNLALGVSIISYAGEVMLGVATDSGLIPEPEAILQAFLEELDYLKNWGRPARRPKPNALEPLTTTPPAQPLNLDKDVRCQALTKEGKPCKNRSLPGQSTCRVHSPKIQ